MDGTVSAFNANTGDVLFTHRDTRPAVDSWTAPGMTHEYVPSPDGRLFRIDRSTEEAQLVEGKFINRRFAARNVPKADSLKAPNLVAADGVRENEPLGADAVILTAEESSVMYIDLRMGRLLKQVSFGDAPSEGPLFPTLSKHVMVISRTAVGVKVLDTETGRELANASLVHTEPSFLDRRRCVTGKGEESDAFVVYMTTARDRVTVKSAKTGEVLWSKDVSSPVVEAHGMGGVKISRGAARETEMIGDGDRDVVVSKEGGYVYATLVDEAEPVEIEERAKMLRDGRERFRLAGVRKGGDFLALGRPSERSRRGEGKLPLRMDRSQLVPKDVTFTVTSRDAGLGILVLIVVGFVGYVLGRRPRGSGDKVRKTVKRRKKRVEMTRGRGTVRMEGGAEREDNETETDPEDEQMEDDEDDSELRKRKMRLSRKKLFTNALPTDSDERSTAMGGGLDAQPESSTGSTGSGGGGYISNRTQSGWMSVGCLQVSSKVLGVGSHGTVVYEGKMMPGERKVAVKRLLRQFFESARKEISLLVELDEASPHVVRYFAMEEDSEFIYLALELCAGTLAERVTQHLPPATPSSYHGGPPPTFVSRALRQLLQGLADLHRVGVVHRDVKPQNVLITRPTSSGRGDVKLADVGLALRLAANRSSYTAVTNAGGGVGTTGWRAPEVLSGGRQTKAVDIFAAGCVVSFVLTGGDHPFGNAIFGRDGNIAIGKPSLESLEALQLTEATDIVTKMVDPIATKRPSAEEALKHPFFWTDAMKLSFLVDISDRLYDTRHDPARYTENLDRYLQSRKFCSDWMVRMDMELLMGLGRGYDNTASGLLRVIRNKRNHYSELPSSLRKLLGELPEDKHRSPTIVSGPDSSGDNTTDIVSSGVNFLTYFTSRVPQLLMTIYQYAVENPVLIDQPHFLRYGLKPIASTDYVALHPLVRKARASRLDTAGALSTIAELGKKADEIVRDQSANLHRDSVDGNECTIAEEDDCADDEEEVVVTIKPTRRAYHRHELVAIQPLCQEMHPEVKRRAIALSLYQPSAFARNRKRLETNFFEESDFDDISLQREEMIAHMDVPPGLQRVMPKHHTQYSASSFGSRAPSSYLAGSLGSSHPLGFAGSGPPVLPASGASGTYGGGPPGFPTSTHGIGNSASVAPHSRRNHAPAIAPTVSQFSGEERVVDFGSLRRRK